MTTISEVWTGLWQKEAAGFWQPRKCTEEESKRSEDNIQVAVLSNGENGDICQDW